MKLKKVVSLAAAALMAVSMLTACGEGTGSNGASSEAPVVNVDSAVTKVIAQLDSDSKVTFTADAEMQKALEDLIEQNGNNASAITPYALVTMNPKFGNIDGLYDLDSKGTEDTDDEEVTFFWVVQTNAAVDGDYAFAQLANKMETTNLVKNQTNVYLTKLPDHGNELGSNYSYYYDFDYTGKIAVAAVKDAATGSVHYVAAFSVTRTPTKHEK